MEENKEQYNSLQDTVIQIKSFLHSLRKRTWLILMIATLGAALGVVYYFMQKPKYKAVCTFILEEKSGGGGALAGLASQIGLNLGGINAGGGIFSGDNILHILKSKKVVQQVLLSKTEETNLESKTLADLYLEFSGIKNNWEQNNALANFSFDNVNLQMTPVQDSVLNALYETIVNKNLITERTSKQGTIIKVQVTAANELFARLMTERIVKEASKMYLDIRIGSAQENILQLQRRSDSLLVLLNNKSYRAAASQLLDINPGIRTAVVPVEIATRDKTVIATLYGEVTKNLEASKLLLSQQTPVIQVLDRPGYLLENNKKSLLLLLFACSLTSIFVYIMGTLIVFLLSNSAIK